MKQKSEVNTWSVTWGVLMAMLFSAAAAYLGLKVGQVFEAAIPIAIIAVGVSTAAKRSNALRENVIIQSIGACSGAVVAGAIFTLPAIYILQAKYPEMSAYFIKIFIAVRRCIGHPVPHPLPQILCGSSAGAVPLPRSHCHHTGIEERRQRQQSSQALAHRRSCRWSLRLHRCHLRMVE